MSLSTGFKPQQNIILYRLLIKVYDPQNYMPTNLGKICNPQISAHKFTLYCPNSSFEYFLQLNILLVYKCIITTVNFWFCFSYNWSCIYCLISENGWSFFLPHSEKLVNPEWVHDTYSVCKLSQHLIIECLVYNMNET